MCTASPASCQLLYHAAGGREHTAGGVQRLPASLALEMFGFLVRVQDLDIVEVTLAVVAPRALELLIEVWVSLAFLRHLCGRVVM